MRQEVRPDVLACDNCGRKPRADENPYETWRSASDGTKEPQVFCTECFKREFEDSTLLNMKSPGDLTASYVWGGRSRYLVRVYHPGVPRHEIWQGRNVGLLVKGASDGTSSGFLC